MCLLGQRALGRAETVGVGHGDHHQGSTRPGRAASGGALQVMMTMEGAGSNTVELVTLLNLSGRYGEAAEILSR